MTNFVSLSIAFSCLWAFVHGHTVLTYPGWRGDNLVTNQTFPFGMQWMYPCGGLGVTTNRTYWPITGGGIAMQPGWFRGHKENLMYINLGLGESPENYQTILVPRFLMTGPTETPYPGTFCLPQVPIPSGVALKSGDLASIQVVQTMAHGASLYNCADIIFTDDMSKVPPMTTQNCFNSTEIKIDTVKIVKGSDASPPGPTGTGTQPTNSRSSLFPTSSAPSEGTAREVSRFSALLSFLFML